MSRSLLMGSSSVGASRKQDGRPGGKSSGRPHGPPERPPLTLATVASDARQAGTCTGLAALIPAGRCAARRPGPVRAGRPSSWTGRPSRTRPARAGRLGRRARRARPTAPRSARQAPRPTDGRPRPSAPARREAVYPRRWRAVPAGRPRSRAAGADAELPADPRPERVPEPFPRLLIGAPRLAELLLGVHQQLLVDDRRQDRPRQEIADVVLAPGEDPSPGDRVTRP